MTPAVRLDVAVDQVGDEHWYLTCVGALCVIGWSAEPPSAVDADEGVCYGEGGKVPPVEPNGLRAGAAMATCSWPLAAMMPTVRSADVSDDVAATLSMRLAYILLGGGAYLGEDSGSPAHLSALVSRLIQPRSGFIA